MLRRTLVILSASALLSAAVGATDPALAFPFGPPPGPPPGLGGLPHGFGGPLPGLGGPPRGLAGPPAGLAGPRAGFGGPPPRVGLGASAGHAAGLSRFGGGSVGTSYGRSVRAGYGYGHSGSRYGRWARDGLSGYATSGYGSGSDDSSYSSNGCSYVYGYRDGAYRRVAVCSDN